MKSPSRRLVLQASALALSAFGGQSLVSRDAVSQTAGNSTAAIVYLSRSGNTRVLAEALSRQFQARLLELRPREPWPEDYDEMVDWAGQVRRQAEPVALAEQFELFRQNTLFLGFPIWGMSMPAPTESFLRSQNLAGKTLLPFITHGGYGVGDALDTLRRLASDARIAEAFVLECDQERETLDRLDVWVTDVSSALPE